MEIARKIIQIVPAGADPFDPKYALEFPFEARKTA